MKKYGFLLIIILLLSACEKNVVQWNGQIEYYANLLLVDDIEKDNHAYVKQMDYVWVGKVDDIISNVISESEDYSYYRI